MPQIASEPVAVLPDEHQHAPCGGDAQDVQHDRLERQQQRAEGARQQEERRDRDQRDHQREVAVDGVDEVVVRGQAGRRRARRDRCRAPCRARRRACPCPHGPLSGVWIASTSAVPSRRQARLVRRHGTVDAVDLAQAGRHLLGIGVALDQNLVGQERPLADAGVLQRREAVLRVAGLRDRVERRSCPAAGQWRRRRAPGSPPAPRRRRTSGGARRPGPSGSMRGSPCRRCAGAASRAATPASPAPPAAA